MAARFGTAAARLGAALAVVAVVFLTLTGTMFASFGADAAQLGMKRRIAGHEAGADVAGVSAITA